jgi:thiamine-phosphate pyrophosphorylase
MPLYPIVDAGALRARGISIEHFVKAVRAAEVEILQYRDKQAPARAVLQNAALIGAVMAGGGCRLILNDRSDLAVVSGWDGVHVGQQDLSPFDAKQVVGPSRWVGVSSHTPEQIRIADASDADYLAIGPVFATGTKPDAEPVVGLEGVSQARALTKKPLVAIGGITRENARSVIDAGADYIAVIGGLLVAGEPIEKVARDFLELFR